MIFIKKVWGPYKLNQFGVIMLAMLTLVLQFLLKGYLSTYFCYV